MVNSAILNFVEDQEFDVHKNLIFAKSSFYRKLFNEKPDIDNHLFSYGSPIVVKHLMSKDITPAPVL